RRLCICRASYGRKMRRQRFSNAYKTKGHRVIAMPLCLTDLAPPAFTAPCRNQTSDCRTMKRQATCPVLFLEKRADCAIRRRNRRQVCRRSYRFGRGSRDDLKIVPTRARQATVGDGCRARSQGTTSGRSAERRETVAVPGQGGVLTVAI